MSANYFNILGISPEASAADVKHAYRSLAKKFHPDSGDGSANSQRFIEVNEAYDFLMDDRRREAYRNNRISPAEEGRREDIYRQWVEMQQAVSRQRAQGYADRSFEEFKESPVYKAAMVVSKVYNYIFVGLGIMMITLPLIGMLLRSEEERANSPMWTVVFPITVGLLFTYGIYYFLFKHDPD